MASDEMRQAARHWVNTYEANHHGDNAPRGATLDFPTNDRDPDVVVISGWPNRTCSECGQTADPRHFIAQSHGNAWWSRQHGCGMTPRTCSTSVNLEYYDTVSELLDALDEAAKRVERDIIEAVAGLTKNVIEDVEEQALEAAQALVGHTLTLDDYKRTVVDAGTDDEASLSDMCRGYSGDSYEEGWDVLGLPPFGGEPHVSAWRYDPSGIEDATIWCEVPLVLDADNRVSAFGEPCIVCS